MVDDEYFTVDEVAALLKLNPQTVRNTIDRGGLPAVRFGQRRIRIRRVDLENFIEASSRRPSERRIAFDESSKEAAALLRTGSAASAADALRKLASAARVLADELHQPQLHQSHGDADDDS